jgi:YVTN family beta-propeller protein
MFKILPVTLFATALAFGVIEPNWAANQVFVTNEGSGDVSVISTETDEVMATFLLGGICINSVISVAISFNLYLNILLKCFYFNKNKK